MWTVILPLREVWNITLILRWYEKTPVTEYTVKKKKVGGSIPDSSNLQLILNTWQLLRQRMNGGW